MNKTNLKPLAWGLLGAGVAVMGTAGALDLPSWLRHSTSTTTPGGTTAAIAAAATGQQVAPTPVTPPLPAMPPCSWISSTVGLCVPATLTCTTDGPNSCTIAR